MPMRKAVKDLKVRWRMNFRQGIQYLQICSVNLRILLLSAYLDTRLHAWARFCTDDLRLCQLFLLESLKHGHHWGNLHVFVQCLLVIISASD